MAYASQKFFVFILVVIYVLWIDLSRKSGSLMLLSWKVEAFQATAIQLLIKYVLH